MRRLVFALLLTGALMTIGSARPHACSCMGPTVPCSAVWDSSDVFVARVLRVGDVSASTTSQPFPKRVVTMQVLERFRGEAIGEVAVATGRGDADCGYRFYVGRTYLIYGYRATDTGELGTGICNRTAPIESAAEDLAYLRGAYQQPATLGSIQGTVTRFDPGPAGRGDVKSPYQGAKITLEGSGGRLETQSAADGTFEFRVPAGKYRLLSAVPDGVYAWPDRPRDVELRDPRGCALVPISVRPDGRIRGRLLDADGKSVPFMTVEVVDAAGVSRPAMRALEKVLSDRDGRFEFHRLPPGNYVTGLSLSRDPRAGRDDAIWFPTGRFDDVVPTVVGAEQRVEVKDLVLPPGVTTVLLTGQVIDEDSQPIAAAKVYVMNPDRGVNIVAGPVDVDPAGQFRVSVIAGRSYRLTAEIQVTLYGGAMPRRGDVPAFVAEPALAPFRISVRRK
jgi:hypothetical protein